jgi:chloramphenicol-sensitive protein RarD
MPTASAETSRGLLYTLIAYTLWGFVFPLYMKALHHVPALVIVSHRIAWSVPFAALILWWLGTLRPTLAKFRSPRVIGLAALTATLITVNWSTYVYAIVSGHAIDAALGYYINPLVNVLMAAVFLKERPSRPQVAAILLAGLAVVILTAQAGGLPWISIVLALSFGSYGLLRKMLPIGPAEGFFLEVALLALPALALMATAVPEGPRHYVPHGAELLLLVGAGPLTAMPLILFAAGAKRLDFSVIGILQYMVPTLLFLTAVTLFGEPFSRWQLVAFALIWASVAIYVWTLLRGGRTRRRRAAEAVARVVEAA